MKEILSNVPGALMGMFITMLLTGVMSVAVAGVVRAAWGVYGRG